ncbi:hypothetical protein [Sphingobium xenophagum]|uniref:Uncharacterized protein n=1 Tax=Sphingobium xenophagum TaxID=121428 RepID=A0A401J5Q7_SPHXE|nr:hypothetical protein [Sphingobium xenophagum]GBH31992.1 hypothetical protein MBESOW_P3253 [Sphingobium xenophagum]
MIPGGKPSPSRVVTGGFAAADHFSATRPLSVRLRKGAFQDRLSRKRGRRMLSGGPFSCCISDAWATD